MRRYYEPGNAYFLTTVTKDRKEIFLNNSLCRILLVSLEYYKIILEYKVLGFCIMPDHLHLIIKPSDRFNPSFIMKMVKGSFTRKVNKLNDTKGSYWQSSFFDEVIRNDYQLRTQLQYVHDNPVKAGLVEKEEDYPYSSSKQYLSPTPARPGALEVDPLSP